MPRQQRILSENGTYHVMMRGNERKNLFHDQEDKQRFIDTLLAKKMVTGFSVYGYCLMDNHVHLLIREGPEGLSASMKRINASYASYFNHKYHRVGHLFQDRFRSEPIQEDRHLLTALRYIHNNPVKAGLVDKPQHYWWSSYGCYLDPDNPETEGIETGFILSILADDPATATREFKRFSSEYDESEFLDLEEGSAWTVEAGSAYLDEYLKRRWPGKNLPGVMNDKNTRAEVILDLKANTRLSVRAIADLLGINRGIVQKTKQGG